MPKTSVPSTEKKSAKKRVVTTTTRKKKNEDDVLDKFLNESIKKHAAHVNKMIQVQWNAARKFGSKEARAYHFFKEILTRFKAEHLSQYPKKEFPTESIQLLYPKLCASYQKTEEAAAKCFFDTEYDFKQTMEIIKKFGVLVPSTIDYVSQMKCFYFGEQSAFLKVFETYDKPMLKAYKDQMGLSEGVVVIQAAPVLERDVYACGATDMFNATEEQIEAAQKMWCERQQKANVADGFILHDRLNKLLDERQAHILKRQNVPIQEISNFLTTYVKLNVRQLGAAVADGRIPASIIPYPAEYGYGRFAIFLDDNDKGEKEVRYEIEKQGEEDVVTINCLFNAQNAFNIFIDDMEALGISGIKYGDVIAQFGNNMKVGTTTVGKSFLDSSDEYVIKTADEEFEVTMDGGSSSSSSSSVAEKTWAEAIMPPVGAIGQKFWLKPIRKPTKEEEKRGFHYEYPSTKNRKFGGTLERETSIEHMVWKHFFEPFMENTIDFTIPVCVEKRVKGPEVKYADYCPIHFIVLRCKLKGQSGFTCLPFLDVWAMKKILEDIFNKDDYHEDNYCEDEVEYWKILDALPPFLERLK